MRVDLGLQGAQFGFLDLFLFPDALLEQGLDFPKHNVKAAPQVSDFIIACGCDLGFQKAGCGQLHLVLQQLERAREPGGNKKVQRNGKQNAQRHADDDELPNRIGLFDDFAQVDLADDFPACGLGGGGEDELRPSVRFIDITGQSAGSHSGQDVPLRQDLIRDEPGRHEDGTSAGVDDIEESGFAHFDLVAESADRRSIYIDDDEADRFVRNPLFDGGHDRNGGFLLKSVGMVQRQGVKRRDGEYDIGIVD
ncbi:hypothetical protein D3C74_226880 [compost metagenome]